MQLSLIVLLSLLSCYCWRRCLAAGIEPNTTSTSKSLNTWSSPSSQSLPPVITKSPSRSNNNMTEGNIRLNWTCVIRSQDPKLHSQIREMIDVDKINLIEYNLIFSHYNASPLISNTMIYKADSWARASSRHGQTLLSLSFNYGVLSMMTLSVGTVLLPVRLQDDPEGCVEELDEAEQFERVLYLMLRDFQLESAEATVTGKERLCHEAVLNDEGYAKFIDMCCYEDKNTKTTICEPDEKNIWLQLLQVILSLIRLGILFFGPLLFTSKIISIARKNFPYMVKLKEPLTKTIVLSRKGSNLDIRPKHRLDLSSAEGFPKLKVSMSDIPLDTPVRIVISQYDIDVSYIRTLTENMVPVGFWRSIFGAVFRCKLRNIGPFATCCRADMFPFRTRSHQRTPWIRLWSKIGLVLMVLLIPSPYYLRLIVFYRFEYDEVMTRKEAAERLGLKEQFNSNPLYYFTPTHPIFVVIYFIYFFTAAVVGFTMRHGKEGPILRIFAGSFEDLNSLPWTTILYVMVSNVIWPFKQFGLVGCLISIVYWPIALTLTFVIYSLYCLPTIYMTVRMIFYSRNNFLLRTSTTKKARVRAYRARKRPDNSIRLFEVDRFMSSSKCTDFQSTDVFTDGDIDAKDLDNLPTRFFRQRSSDLASIASTITISLDRNLKKCCVHLLASSLCVLALYSVLVILSECIGCLFEVALFTLMGVIVNASVLLKYVALVILLVVYSYDCFNNVQKNYLKLNKSLFNEVKGRIKDIDVVTSQPSNMQENHGFKAQELSEQAFYEVPDDIESRPPGFWLINDLVLFVDNEDMPRIPRKLFEDVCEIQVAGVPGPVYRGHLLALGQFLKIVLFVFFVFIVVLSFSEAYKVSSTNQMLATLAGGFLPLILRTFMGSSSGFELELNTLSFKSKLDEIIKNFYQYWPIYDFPFELAPTPEEQTSTLELAPCEQQEKEVKDQEEEEPVLNESADESILALIDNNNKMLDTNSRRDEALKESDENNRKMADGRRTSREAVVDETGGEIEGESSRHRHQVVTFSEEEWKLKTNEIDILIELPEEMNEDY